MTDPATPSSSTASDIAAVATIATAVVPALIPLLEMLFKALAALAAGGGQVDPAAVAAQLEAVTLVTHQGLVDLGPDHRARVAAVRAAMGLPVTP